MITLLHGPDIQASRNELLHLRSQAVSSDIRLFDGSSIQDADLIQALDSQSLFGTKVLVVIENLLSKRGKKTSPKDALLQILRTSANTADIILWEDREIPAGMVNVFGKWITIRLFTYPKVIFQLLDSMKPKNPKILLNLYTSCLATSVPEVIYTMILRRIRQLIMMKDNVTPEQLADWQLRRLTNQAKSFTMDQLLTMYHQLAELEYSFKTGKSPFTFSQLIEQFLVDV